MPYVHDGAKGVYTYHYLDEGQTLCGKRLADLQGNHHAVGPGDARNPNCEVCMAELVKRRGAKRPDNKES